MNANSAAILTDPHPCGHIVYPYTDEGLVGQAVTLFASGGLRNGEGVILVMTASHCDSVRLRLVTEGYDVDALERSGRLAITSAEDLLAQFLFEGVPDEDVFKNILSRMIAESKASTGKGTDSRVRVFGEMVSLLWNADLGATISLEEMWGRIIEQHSVSLMCTYALGGRKDIPVELHALHSHSLQPE
jgi:KaiC/GvpD/RAD55 family RecA-like ATPase